MLVGGIQKLTLLDYPGKTACIIFTKGCNFRCPFCHNSELLEAKGDHIDIEEIMEYLEKRKNILDGVVISGGEPLINKDIEDLIVSIKSLGYEIKLDTNGTNPKMLKNLIDKGLIDYVAMDIKTDFDNYSTVAGVMKVDIESIKKSIEIIETSNIGFEFRTTVAKELHGYKNLKSICEYIKPTSKYYIQNYRECETVLKPGLTSFEESELKAIVNILNEEYPNVLIR